MPKGDFHTLEGVLALTPGGFTLFADGGGHWLLDFGPRGKRAWKQLGERIHVEGYRDGFNLLAVTRMVEGGVARPYRVETRDGRTRLVADRGK